MMPIYLRRILRRHRTTNLLMLVRATAILILRITVAWPGMVVMTDAIRVPLRNRLALHLVFFLLAHAMYLFLEEAHLVGVPVPYLILLPLLVLAALLDFPAEYVEAVEVLHRLQLVVEVKLTVPVPAALVRHRNVVQAGAVEQVLVLIA